MLQKQQTNSKTCYLERIVSATPHQSAKLESLGQPLHRAVSQMLHSNCMFPIPASLCFQDYSSSFQNSGKFCFQNRNMQINSSIKFIIVFPSGNSALSMPDTTANLSNKFTQGENYCKADWNDFLEIARILCKALVLLKAKEERGMESSLIGTVESRLPRAMHSFSKHSSGTRTALSRAHCRIRICIHMALPQHAAW